MNRSFLPKSLSWVAALLLAGCVTVPEFRALQDEVAAMKAVGNGGGASGDRVADLGAEVESLRHEVDLLRGQLEEARHAADLAMQEVKALQDQPGTGTAQPPGSDGPYDDPSTLPGNGGGTATEEVRAYEEAFRMYRGGEYSSAVDRFRGFLQTHPSSDYADNALFWIGECYFKLGDYERAVLAFEDVTKRFPQGNKVADALYRQGVALIEIGKKNDDEGTYNEAARQIFDRIVRDHPQSERVPEAKRQLEKLGS